MAEKKFEDDDPMELTGTMCQDGDENSMDQMGFAFVEEFARMGWSRDEMITIFMDPFYRGPHTVYRAKGLGYVTWLLDQIPDRLKTRSTEAEVSAASLHTCRNAGKPD
jgi:hypothetical protein